MAKPKQIKRQFHETCRECHLEFTEKDWKDVEAILITGTCIDCLKQCVSRKELYA